MKHPHWDYYLTILEDLAKVSRFIEFTSANFHTYSVEFVRIILSVGSEVDVVAKLLCERIKPQDSSRTISDYRQLIVTEYPFLPTVEITAPKHGLAFTPWHEWTNGQNPTWWAAYNNVKHHRNIYYADATLENALLSSSALCVLLGYLYADFFASDVVQRRPLLFFDSKYESKSARVLVAKSFKLP
jgi:hypothetical protein